MRTRLIDSVRRAVRRPVATRDGSRAAAAEHAQPAAVVDLALRAAALAVQTGAVTSEAIAFALTITSAYGLPAEVDVTWTSVTISYHRRGRAEPITGFRGVRERVTDYTQLTLLLRLIDDIGTGAVPLDDARARFDRLASEAKPYRSWVIALGQALLGAGVAAILGGRPEEMAIAAFANAALFVVQLWLSRTGLSSLFIQAFGAAVPTTIAVIIMQLRAVGHPWLYWVSPSLVVASGIVSLLAGVGVVAAARDAMDGNLLTATARSFDAVMQTAGIVLGVVITLWVGLWLGVESYIAPTTGWAVPSIWQMLWAGLIAIGAAVGFQLGLRNLPLCGVLAVIGYGVYQGMLPVIGNSPGAAALGAFAVGFLAQVISGRWRIPLIALVTIGVVSMMPGSALYRGLYEAIRSFNEPLSVHAQVSLGQAVLIALALAAGSTLGSQLARPLGLPAARLFRLATLRSLRRSKRSPASTEAASR